jgi:glucose-6-phosphate dehydrogenase assembly protein OpcA
MTATVDPEKILRDLRQQWVDLGRQQGTAGGVLRACSMTLLVVAEDERDAENVRRTMGVLMHDHPSRAVVLHTEEGASFDARVFAECWMPSGGNQQICAEGIEITAGAQQLSGLARLLVPLIVPDLPVMLWCRGKSALNPGVFDPLFRLAGKIIFDSGAAPEPQKAIEELKALRARGLRVADLAWGRLTGWRQVLANVFYDAEVRPAGLQSVSISHGGPASSSVLYFAAWIEQRIPSARVTLEPSEGEAGLRGVTLSGEGAEIEIRLADGSLVQIRAGERRCHALLPPVSDDSVMREELSIFGDDPVFDSVIGG